MTLFKKGEFFPPTSDEARIERYHVNREIFLGHHDSIFQSKQDLLTPEQLNKLYISSNIAGLICRKSADFLFGEKPTFTSGKKNNSNEQKRLEGLVNENGLYTKFYESAMSNSYRGDTFYKIRYGQKYGGLVDSTLDHYRVFIEPQKAEYVFIETIPGSNTVLAYHIAIPKVVEGTGDQEWILDVESHYVGVIKYSKYQMSPLTFSSYENRVESWKIVKELYSDREDVETEINEHLIVHIPNLKTDDMLFGIDDLTEHHSLFAELNNRLNKIAMILDKHSDPILAVPEDMLEEDANGNRYLNASEMKAVGIQGKDDVKPEYIVWNASLDAAFRELDFILNQILLVTEMPGVALGLQDSGTSGGSGLSIKWRMSPLLAKINRKRQYFDEGIKKILHVAQLLEHANNDNVDYEVFTPHISFKDGLPDDDREKAQIINMRTNGKSTLSQKTALMEQYDMTEEQAEEEIKRIRAEDEADGLIPSSTNRGRVHKQEDPIVNQNEKRKGFDE
ncbi:phage portal protein [Bacillus sp. JJ1533]|uniref:phage portal protein n=1 Tax=Bacillus sp. JJ1533 TaxID=3122959 RepID=UPI002FFFC812